MCLGFRPHLRYRPGNRLNRRNRLHPWSLRRPSAFYAHLSGALVSKGQFVKVGERIALAGETGHTRGPYLHLTLKLIGARTPGYPPGVVDPLSSWPGDRALPAKIGGVV